MAKNSRVELSIIIVTYNNANWLPDCLTSLQAQIFTDYELIVVDNASSDNSIALVQKYFPDSKVFALDENVGFSKANNLGVKNAHGNRVLLLNSDTRMCSPGFLSSFLKEQQKNQLDICNPLILNAQGVDPLAGLYMGMDIVGFPGPSPKLFYIDGCCLLTYKHVYERLGGLDEDYFMYSEDIDFSWRARLLNLRLGICRSSAILHYGGGSTESTRSGTRGVYKVPAFRRYEVEKNILSNLLKNYGVYNLTWAIPLFLVLNFSEALFYLMLGKLWLSRKVLLAVWWNVRNINHTLKKRRQVQQTRQVSDSTLLKNVHLKLNKVQALINIGGIPKFTN